MPEILSIQNIHKTFSDTYTGLSGEEEVDYAHVLKGVSFELAQGTVTALIGGNGSGKSTLFNVINGLLPATKGEVLYYHNNASYKLSHLKSYKHARIGIARLFQGSNIFRDLSVLENLMLADDVRIGEQPWDLFVRPKAVKKQEQSRHDKAFSILKNLLGKDNPLWLKRDEPAGSLSIGQQRLLAFARLFMNDKARLFLLDEPCAGVNSQIRDTMAKMIAQLEQKNKTVLLIEHNMDFAQQVASQAHYLEEGKIAYSGLINEVLQQEIVKRNYLGDKEI